MKKYLLLLALKIMVNNFHLLKRTIQMQLSANVYVYALVSSTMMIGSLTTKVSSQTMKTTL